MIVQTVDHGVGDFGASKVARQLACRMQRYTAQIQQGKVHIVLQGLAHCPEVPATGQAQPTCLLHPDDAIPWSIQEFPNTTAAGTLALRARNPWMANAAASMTAWVTEFANEYKRIALSGILDPGLPATGCNVLAQVASINLGGGQSTPLYAFPIDRLLLDSETYPDIRDDRVMKAMANGTADPLNRWSTLPVPGFNGRTMAQLWAEAEADWDTSATFFAWQPSLADVVSVTNPPAGTSYFNALRRRPYLWYNTIAFQAKQAVLESAVLEPMRNILADLGTVPRTGNYGEFAADVQADDFGWQRVRGPSANRNEDPVGSTGIPTPPMVDSRVRPRIALFSPNESSRMIGYDALGWWYNFKTRPRAAYTVDQPQLYQVDTTNSNYNHKMRMKNLYLPSHPDEVDYGAIQRVHRHRLETAINSYSGLNEYMVEPYFPPANTTQGAGANAYYFSRTFARDQFAMARAKQLRQINVLQGNGPASLTPSATVWGDTRSVMRQAHAFRIDSWTWTMGDDPDYSYHPLGDVTNTLRDPLSPYGPDTVLVATSIYDDWATTEAIATFVPWLEADGASLQINYEGRIDIPGNESVFNAAAFPAYGEILLWDWYDTSHVGGWWHAVEFGDDPANVGRYLFGTSDLSTRRAAVIGDGFRFVSPSGKVRVMLRHVVHFSEIPEGYFRSKHDLLQVMRHDTQVPIEPEEMTAGVGMMGPDSVSLGADINHDAIVDGDDLCRFLEAYAADAPTADYNGDNAVTQADADGFLQDFSQGL